MNGHSLKYIIATFDPTIGKPLDKDCQVVLDWPHMARNGESEAKNHTVQGVSAIINLIPGSSMVPDLVKNLAGTAVYKLLAISGVGNILILLDDIFSGKVDLSQYFEVHSHELSSKAQETRSAKDNFALKYEGHFKSRAVDHKKDVLANNDQFLEKLVMLKVDNKNLYNIDKIQLNYLKSQYMISQEHDKFYIVINPKSNLTITDLREHMSRLREVSPEVEKFILNPSLFITTKRKLSMGNGELISDNLNSTVEHFIGREEIIEKVAKLHDKIQLVAISALGGSGKSSTAKKYGQKQIKAGKITKWFDSATVEALEYNYNNLAKSLGCDVVGKGKEEIVQFVNKKLADKAQTSNIILIYWY
jgi:hypothetical protein